MQVSDTGRRLCKAMDAANVSVNGLSRETGLSRATIRNMRKGDTRGSLYSWCVVCDALGVSLSELTGDKRGQREG